MGKILSFLPVDGLNNLFHICLGESVISIGWLLLFWNFLFNSQSCSGAVVLQLPRNFVDFFFFQKAVLSWPLVMGAFPKFHPDDVRPWPSSAQIPSRASRLQPAGKPRCTVERILPIPRTGLGGWGSPGMENLSNKPVASKMVEHWLPGNIDLPEKPT